MTATIRRPSGCALLALVVAALVPAAVQAAPATPAIDVTGASYLEVDERTGIWSMRGGPVVVTRGSRIVEAASITYDSRRQLLTATGSVRAREEGLQIAASNLVVFLQEERLVAEGEVSAVVADPTPPTQLRADRLEVWSSRQQALASGGVRVTRGEMTLDCARLTYDLRTRYARATGRPRVVSPTATLSAEWMGVQFDREELTAEGDVHLSADSIAGTAPTMVFQSAIHLVTLSGGAVVRRRQDELRAQVITIDLERKRLVATGGAHVVVFPNP